MSTLSNNLTQGCDLTHEKLIPETEFTKTTDFDATSLPIFTDMENGAESDSNVAEFNNESEDISNATESNNESEDISNVTEFNNTSEDISTVTKADSKIALDKGGVSSIRTDRKLIQMIKDALSFLFYGSLSDGQIIQLAVMYIYACHMMNDNEEIENEEIINETKNQQGKKIFTVSFRIIGKLKNMVKKIFHTKNFSLAIHCCLMEFYNHILASKTLSQCNMENLFSFTQKPLEPNEYLFSRFGLKNKRLLDVITRSIEEIRIEEECNKYCEVFTGTANVLLHLIHPFEFEEINDKDKDMTNLLFVIQQWIDEFIFRLLQCPVTKETFDELRKKENKSSQNKKDKLNNAVKFYFTTLLSYYGKGDSLRSNVTDETLLRKLITLFKMHQRLSKTKITSVDAFYFLKIKEKSNILIKKLYFLDPPYIGTEFYYYKKGNIKKILKKIKNGSFHKSLRNQIQPLIEEGSIFVICYRATVTLNNPYKMKNEDVQKILNSLYKGNIFSIQFVEIPHVSKVNGREVPDNQIEIVLTNVQVSGSTPYDCDIDELIELWKMENVVFDRYNRTANTSVIRNETPVPITWAIEDALKRLDELYLNTESYIQFIPLEAGQFKIKPLTKKRAKNVSGSIPYNDKIATLIQKYVK